VKAAMSAKITNPDKIVFMRSKITPRRMTSRR
jgi:hypothetical protein